MLTTEPSIVRRAIFGALAAAAFACVAGCASLPPRTAVGVDYAWPPARDGRLAELASRVVAELALEESAHWLLDRNDLAFERRLILADEAAYTLDIQYFIWQDDATGQLMTQRLLAAADRGVKIRLLVDDFGVSSERGDVLRLDAHPAIEVRTFNPWATRGSRFTTAVEFLTRAYELNRRMHNKTVIADNLFAILGGRNIGDRYFGIYDRFVQNDLDVLLAGPVVTEVTSSFDAYWNSEHSYPVALFARDERPAEPLAETRAALAAGVAAAADRLAPFGIEPRSWSQELAELERSFVAGRADLLWDTPAVLDAGRPRLYEDFKRLVASARSEVLISSPYLVPDAEFRALLADLVARGVRVAIVTNSLATNNHVIAHTGYRRWRRQLLMSGVELYELRADAAALEYYVAPPATSAGLGLHTKAVVIDGERAFVGSPNVDPRSMVLNTEIGVVTEGREFAALVAGLIERDMSSPNAWRVSLEDGKWLRWSSEGEVLRRQPAKGFGQRAIEFLLSLLPLKDQA